MTLEAAPKSKDIYHRPCNIVTIKVGIKKPIIFPKSPLADQRPKIVPSVLGSKYWLTNPKVIGQNENWKKP